MKTWTGKKLGKRTAKAAGAAHDMLGTEEGKKKLHGFGFDTELLVGEEIERLVAATDRDRRLTRESLAALMDQVRRQAEKIARWAIAAAELKAAQAARAGRPT